MRKNGPLRSPRDPAAFFLAFATGLVLVGMAGAAPVLRAEFVVFTHGGAIKAKSHRIAEDRIQIHLSGGGSLTFDRTLVDRIEEDEVAEAVAEAAPVQPPAQVIARVAASRPALNEQVITPKEFQAKTETPKASEENRPAATQRRQRRHRQ